MVSITSLGVFLQGSWDLERIIIDQLGGRNATMIGAADWTPMSGGELLYTETGTVSVGAFIGAAKRSYRFVLSADESADVLFEDGGFFYRLDLTTGRAEVEHQCDSDSYVGLFEARSERDLRQQWQVNGPAKTYLSTTTLRKRSSA